TPAGSQRPRQAEKRPPQSHQIRPAWLVAEKKAEHGAGIGEEQVWNQLVPRVNVFPTEQDEVLLEHVLDLALGKAFSDGAAVLVIDLALRLIEHFPAAF